MGLQEIIEFLEVKTESKLDKERVLKIIEQNNLSIVFEYEGWAVWETGQANRPLQMELKGYFKHINNATMIQAYTGFLKELVIYKAEIHDLDYCKIRNKNDAPESCKPRVGDLISFVNGGRSPLFSSTSQGYVVIKKSNIGVLRSELEKSLSKSKLSYEELQARISELEVENSQLKEQLEQASRPVIDEGQGDTLLILGAVMQCIRDVAKPNYTQQSLIEVIKDKYPNVDSLSESTLTKKFPTAKKHLNQNLTP